MRTTPLRPRFLAAGLLCGLAASACVIGSASAQTPAPGSGPQALQAHPTASRPPASPADVAFMSGMIVHHRQSIVMALLAPTHEAGPAVRELCERILVSQRDEIATMARWLREHHQAVPDSAPAAGGGMAGMDHPMLMSGMLTDGQLARLDGARGPAFDRLFLTFMIQHHEGALTMVEQLMGTAGAAQDGFVFQSASDVNADQTAEIDRMRRMLAALSLQ